MNPNWKIGNIHIKGFVRRRKGLFLAISGILFILIVLVAIVLPPVYVSRTTILVDEQQIPQDVVKSGGMQYVEDRLQAITEQIIGRTKLIEIIDRLRLYPDLSGSPVEERVDRMRKDISLKTISAEGADRRLGRPKAGMVAFTLSYEGRDPATAKAVTETLASLYLETNMQTREQRATSTADFLQKELDQIKAQMNQLANKISEYKNAHSGELPEFKAFNMEQIQRLERSLEQVNTQIRSLQERKIYLEGQLATVDPLNPVKGPEGKAVMNPPERLRYLRMELVSLKSTLSDQHPDVIRTRREIRELEARLGETDASGEKIKRIRELKAEQAEMNGRLGPQHPDVIRASKELDALNRDVESAKGTQPARERVTENPENPAYINLKTQIASADMELKSYIRERDELKQRVGSYFKKNERAPLVEREYNTLVGDYENSKTRYNEIMKQLMDARVAQGMEASQLGTRFTIIEPANLPERAEKPKRLLIILIGFVLALITGASASMAAEGLDRSIKTAGELQRFAGVPILSVVPFLGPEEDVESPAKKLLKQLQERKWREVLPGFVLKVFDAAKQRGTPQ
jgi:succinoglycan biosynthesis transport protein ExoP